MAQKDTSPAARYIFEVQALLDHPLDLSLPDAVLEVAAQRAFAAGISPEEAAIRICHEHAKLVSQVWVEEGSQASDLAEFVVSCRIDESAKLAVQTGLSLPDLLPDLADYLRQPCFSDALRDMVANVTTWHGIPEHRWDVPDGQAAGLRRASA